MCDVGTFPRNRDLVQVLICTGKHFNCVVITYSTLFWMESDRHQWNCYLKHVTPGLLMDTNIDNFKSWSKYNVSIYRKSGSEGEG